MIPGWFRPSQSKSKNDRFNKNKKENKVQNKKKEYKREENRRYIYMYIYSKTVKNNCSVKQVYGGLGYRCHAFIE